MAASTDSEVRVSMAAVSGKGQAIKTIACYTVAPLACPCTIGWSALKSIRWTPIPASAGKSCCWQGSGDRTLERSPCASPRSALLQLLPETNKCHTSDRQPLVYMLEDEEGFHCIPQLHPTGFPSQLYFTLYLRTGDTRYLQECHTFYQVCLGAAASGSQAQVRGNCGRCCSP
jgi:hypothetical protein